MCSALIIHLDVAAFVTRIILNCLDFSCPPGVCSGGNVFDYLDVCVALHWCWMSVYCLLSSLAVLVNMRCSGHTFLHLHTPTKGCIFGVKFCALDWLVKPTENYEDWSNVRKSHGDWMKWQDCAIRNINCCSCAIMHSWTEWLITFLPVWFNRSKSVIEKDFHFKYGLSIRTIFKFENKRETKRTSRRSEWIVGWWVIQSEGFCQVLTSRVLKLKDLSHVGWNMQLWRSALISYSHQLHFLSKG